MGKLTPPDPRKMLPKHADPEHRGMRKELEKKHGYGYTEPLLLGLIGIGLIWNIENQVSKREIRKEEEASDRKDREGRQRQRSENPNRAGTWDPSRSDKSSQSGRNDRGTSRHDRDESRYKPRHSRHDPDDDRYDERDEPRRLEYRDNEYRGYRDQYRDYHNDCRYEDRRYGSPRRSSRRDSF